MTLRSLRRPVLALVVLSVAPPLVAQGTIAQNDVALTRSATCWTSAPDADFVGVSTPTTDDHLYSLGWWYRVAGDSHEFSFPAPDTQSYVGRNSDATWSDVDGRGLFRAEEQGTIFDYGDASGPRGLASLSMTVWNLSLDTPLGIEVFSAVDIDLQPDYDDDFARLAEWTPNRIIEVTDWATDNFAQYEALANSAIAATHFLVRESGYLDVRTNLSDGALTDFDDSGLPFLGGDITLGWQFSIILPPGGHASATIFVEVNSNSRCWYSTGVFCDGFERTDTSLWSATAN